MNSAGTNGAAPVLVPWMVCCREAAQAIPPLLLFLGNLAVVGEQQAAGSSEGHA
jgi:hypothetical protein